MAVAQADGQRKVAKEKCETLGSDAQKACKDQAEATLRIGEGPGPGDAGRRQALGFGRAGSRSGQLSSGNNAIATG